MSQFNYQQNQTLTITYENKPKLVRLIEVLSDHENYIMAKDNGKLKKFLKSRILTVAPRINFEKVYESITDEEAVKAVDEVEKNSSPQATKLKFTSYPTSFIGVIQQSINKEFVATECKRRLEQVVMVRKRRLDTFATQCKRQTEFVATQCKRRLF